MKIKCAICNTECSIGITRIIRTKGKDWVCRDCLKKADLSVMSSQGKTAEEISARIYCVHNHQVNAAHDNSSNIINHQKKQFIKRTITCKTCGAEISPRAKRCPHCGEMTPGEVLSQVVKGLILAPFLGILILIALGFYLGWFGWLL